MYQVIEKDWKLFRKLLPARGVSRSNMFQLIINLIYEETISEDDLKEFSESLRENIHVWLEIDRRYRDE